MVTIENAVYSKIQELEDVALLSKHEQLVKGIINAIDAKVIVQGSMLPSVNNMVKELGFARKTIVKAYNELKDRGIIESKNRLGYFVANEATDQTMKVAVLLYAFHPFQEIFYNTLREALGENYQLDVFFHHNNPEVYENILLSIIGRYGMYVVAPIHDIKTQTLLSKIPANRLLIVDRYEHIGDEYSYISQEFEKSTFKVLTTLKHSINKYEEFVLFFKEDADYPIGSLKAFKRFINVNKIKGRIENKYQPSLLKKGTVYMTFSDVDLWKLLKDCNQQGFILGEDIGVLSTNDSPVKEFISGGITTYCADFGEMANMASDYIKERKSMQLILPVKIEKRNSL